jgi:flavin reductase (DIM6/NTAB) family NADH-FMN oxidoreductase RutF
MAEHDFNTLMAALDSPLIVVTTADERERAGCLVEFHAQSSIEPQRYCVWLSKANYTYRVALHSSQLVIHFLTADDYGRQATGSKYVIVPSRAAWLAASNRAVPHRTRDADASRRLL